MTSEDKQITYWAELLKESGAGYCEEDLVSENVGDKAKLVALVQKAQDAFVQIAGGQSDKTLKIIGQFDDLIAALQACDCLDEAEVNEAYETPYEWDATKSPITTVKNLKDALSHFKDNDVIDICDQVGEPGHKIISMWNANMEYEMTGTDDGRDDVCYMRID